MVTEKVQNQKPVTNVFNQDLLNVANDNPLNFSFGGEGSREAFL